MNFDPVIFREYDIRGVYEKDFDLEFCKNLAISFANLVREKRKTKTPRIALARDMRLSSPAIKEAVLKGFLESGVHIFHLGLTTTPISYFSLEHLSLDAACMITASHNPGEFNGFKFSLKDEGFHGKSLQDLLKSLSFVDKVERNSKLSKEEDVEIFAPYIENHKREFNFTNNNLKIVADCGNGAAGTVIRKLFESMNLNTTYLFEEPDGRFPNHHPDPCVEKNLETLKSKVLSEKADVGLAFDGDCDRIGVVNERGEMVPVDKLLCVYSESVLKKNKGAKIIADVKCSNVLFQGIEKHGGIPVMWKTGHSLIKEKTKKENSPLGGEFSGHIFFQDRGCDFDDALYAGLRLLEILHKEKKPLSLLMKDIPKTFNTPEVRIRTTEGKKKEVVNSVIDRVKKSEFAEDSFFLDGVRVNFPDGWALIRESHTEPIVVFRFEAQDLKSLHRIQKQVKEWIPESWRLPYED